MVHRQTSCSTLRTSCGPLVDPLRTPVGTLARSLWIQTGPSPHEPLRAPCKDLVDLARTHRRHMADPLRTTRDGAQAFRTPCRPLEDASRTPCRCHADSLRTACGLLIDLLSAPDVPLWTPCRPLSDLLRTACGQLGEPFADPLRIPCGLFVDLLWGPLADPLQVPC